MLRKVMLVSIVLQHCITCTHSFFGKVIQRIVVGRKYYPKPENGIVVVTGASSGIGKHCAETLADKYENFQIVATVRKQSDVEAIVGLNKKNLKPLILDVSKHESCLSAASEIKQIMNYEDIPLVAVVNNAGVYRGGIPLEFHPVDDAKRMFDTNFFGAMDFIQQMLPMLRESKGRVCFVSSIAGFEGIPMEGLYCATKYACEGLIDALRREVAHFGISVSDILPGPVKTPIGMNAATVQNKLFTAEQCEMMEKLYNLKEGLEAREAAMSKAVEVDEVTVAIEDALVSTHPKTRYYVGNGNGIPSARLHWLLKILPDRVVDKIFFDVK